MRPDGVLVGRRVLLLGAGGLAAEVADLVRLLGGRVAGFFEENPASGRTVQDLMVVDSPAAIECDCAVLAVGDTALRQRFLSSLPTNLEIRGLAHPSASISDRATLGRGVIIMQNVVVSASATVGEGALLNVGCYIAHDSSVGDFVHVGPGVQVGGHAAVGQLTVCGLGSVVLPHVRIGSRCICGAGAILTEDTSDDVVLAGVPARVMRPVRDGESRF